MREGLYMPNLKQSVLPPKPFYLIFFLEFWERFGFYGVQAIIVLYMIQQLNYTDQEADILFASFNALIYLLPALGGYIGDHFLGTKRTTLWGAIILGLGYLSLTLISIFKLSIFPALALIVVGSGFFKANPSALVSQIYQKNNLNSDSGFTLYYMAINIGALMSISLTPVIYQRWGWTYAFLLCFIGMLIGTFSLLVGRNMIKLIGSKPDFERVSLKTYSILFLFVILLTLSAYWLIKNQTVMFWLLIFGTTGFIILFLYLMMLANQKERRGMGLFLVLFLQAIIFFVLYFQAPTSLTLFALRNVTPTILGIPIHPASFQALNPFWIMIMSPILAVLYQYLSAKNKDISMPSKFALGTFLAGCGFLVLPLGGIFASAKGIISSNWLVLSYFLQSVGELLISALGLSLVARYIPHRLIGFTMGLWFLGSSIGSRVAGSVAALASVPKESMDPLQSLPIYNQLFLKIGVVTVIMALLMAIFIPKLKKLVKDHY